MVAASPAVVVSRAALETGLAVITVALQALAAAVALTRSPHARARRVWISVGAALLALASSAVIHLRHVMGEPGTGSGAADVLAGFVGASVLLGSLSLAAVTVRRARSKLTALQQSSADLEEGRRRLDALFRLAPDALILCDPNGRILDANSTAERLTGEKLDEVIGASIADLAQIVGDDGSVRSIDLRTLRSLGPERTVPLRLRMRRGHVLPVQAHAQQISDRSGASVLLSLRDFHEQRLREDIEAERVATLSLFLDHLPAHVWTTDAEMQVTSARGSGLTALGTPAEKLVGRRIDHLFRPVTQDSEHPSMLHRRALDGQTVSFLHHVRGHALEGVIAPLRDDAGDVVGTIGIALNVTERERDTAQAEAHRAMLRQLLEHCVTSVFLKDRDGRFLWASWSWRDVPEVSPSALIGKTDAELFKPEEAQKYRRDDLTVWESGEPLTTVEQVTLGRNSRTVMTSKFLLRTDDGTPIALCGMATDITDRARLEQELRRRQALLTEAQAMAHLASWEVDLRTGYQFWSPELYAILGAEPMLPADLAYQEFLDYVVEEDRKMLLDAMMAAVNGSRRFQAEFRVRRSDGRVRWLASQGHLEADETGQAVRFYGITQDVTDEREAADQVRCMTTELEKRVRERTVQLEAAVQELSSFSSAVSHDLRQPLRHISSFLMLLSEEMAYAGLTDNVHLERARLAADRMDKTIQDLLTLARLARQPLSPQRIDLGQMAREIIGELTAGEPERTIEWVVPDLIVEADPAVARSILRHLLGNAFESTSGRHGARIELGRQEDARGGCLFVRDNGDGFDASCNHRRGEPQQNSDTPGEFLCTGIGLATVARAVRHHGGTLRVESRPNRGAAYYFTLPVPSGRTDAEAA